MTMTTKTTKTTNPTATKRAQAAKRSAVTPVTDPRKRSAEVVAALESGTMTEAEALSAASTLETAIAVTGVTDSIATLRIVGAVAVHAAAKPTGKNGKLEGAQAIADRFVTLPIGKDSGRAAGSVKQGIDVYRVADLWATVAVWQDFAAKPEAKASDPKAYTIEVKGFLRFNAALKAKRVDMTSGIIFATTEAATKSDTTATAAAKSEESSAKAKDRAAKVRKASVAAARKLSKASDKYIGKVAIADVAAMTPAQRKQLADLLKSLD